MKLRCALFCDYSVRINDAAPIVIPSQNQIPRVIVIREPDLVLGDEPVRDVGEV